MSLYQMTGFNLQMDYWPVITTGMIQGFGMGFLFVPLSTMAFATIAPKFRADGTAMFSLVRNMGQGVGISLVIFLLTRNTQIVHSELVGHVTPFNDALGALGPAQIWNRATTVGLAALDAEVTKQASVVAYADDFKLMMLVALVALPLIFLLRRARAHPGEMAVGVAEEGVQPAARLRRHRGKTAQHGDTARVVGSNRAAQLLQRT